MARSRAAPSPKSHYTFSLQLPLSLPISIDVAIRSLLQLPKPNTLRSTFQIPDSLVASFCCSIPNFQG
ncbi:hypothetical protein L1987_34422 [Smallanthus sonchifolius]|uniref:Uncharacterized protein n=1 Tax=Smallanthus sonchifolius TaxID=185202 RepID=A0ACB9HTG8_9ASTR|nr:hypothetical protein L1987_34422 [Smallanthus sonchifolius]